MYGGLPHIMGGARVALGGGIFFVLALGLVLTGIAVLAINIVLLIKVARMEKILKRQAADAGKPAGPS